MGRIQQDQVGLVAGTDVASFFYLIKLGRGVAHLLHQLFDGELSLVDELHHGHERELQGRHAGDGLQCAALLFAQQVRGMVGADDIDEVAGQGLAEGVTVGLRLDGGVALDACSEFLIILVAEEEVRYASLGGDVLLADGLVFEQGEFAGGADVHDVQTCTRFLGQLYGQCR